MFRILASLAWHHYISLSFQLLFFVTLLRRYLSISFPAFIFFNLLVGVAWKLETVGIITQFILERGAVYLRLGGVGIGGIGHLLAGSLRVWA